MLFECEGSVSNRGMQGPRELKHFGYAFLIAVVGYVVLYWGVESFRPARGPWVVEFQTNSAGVPSLIISQARLGISNVQVIVLGSAPTNFNAAKVTFDKPRPVPFALPFGQCIFLDTTVLPGTVTMAIENHEIELLPRVLVINQRRHRWQPGAVFDLAQTNSPAQ